MILFLMISVSTALYICNWVNSKLPFVVLLTAKRSMETMVFILFGGPCVNVCVHEWSK